MIYRVDSVIQPLNNQGLMIRSLLNYDILESETDLIPISLLPDVLLFSSKFFL